MDRIKIWNYIISFLPFFASQFFKEKEKQILFKKMAILHQYTVHVLLHNIIVFSKKKHMQSKKMVNIGTPDILAE